MKRTAEAGLALLVVLLIGGGFWLFADGEIGGTGTNPTTPVEEVDVEAAARGMQLATDRSCVACHTVDGTTGTGPTWKGLAGSSRPLETGESVVADTAYLFASIVDPGAQIVQGFAPVMPTDYSDTLTQAEIDDLVAYIQSLAG